MRSLRYWGVPVMAALLVVALAMPASGNTKGHHPKDQRIHVRVMVLTTFDGEQEPWLRHETFDRTLVSKGAFAPVHCQSETGICVTMTGMTKSNSGPSTMALLTDPQLVFDRSSLFIVDGIAGIRSSVGTLGTVGIANWVVDLDLGTHLRPSDAPPDGWLSFQSYPEGVLHLNEALAARAFDVAGDVALADDATARAERAKYGKPQADAVPAVKRCDDGGSDGFFVGTWWANKADRITKERIGALDPAYAGYRCASEFEDPAIGSALKRFGYLDRLIVVRAASDLEDERPGTTAKDLYDLLHSAQGFAGYEISRENGYRVASAIAHRFGRERDGAP
jgi:purine nucleoside permease